MTASIARMGTGGETLAANFCAGGMRSDSVLHQTSETGTATKAMSTIQRTSTNFSAFKLLYRLPTFHLNFMAATV